MNYYFLIIKIMRLLIILK